MKEGRKPEHPEKTPGDELQKMPHTTARRFKPQARLEPAQQHWWKARKTDMLTVTPRIAPTTLQWWDYHYHEENKQPPHPPPPPAITDKQQRVVTHLPSMMSNCPSQMGKTPQATTRSVLTTEPLSRNSSKASTMPGRRDALGGREVNMLWSICRQHRLSLQDSCIM